MASLLTDTMVEQARNDAQQVQELHYLIKHVFQRNLIAPIDDVLAAPGAQCLDIGCGLTATWLIGKTSQTEYDYMMF
jgi:2-polyprenyl-3-methyl-5-hydroxy-6-metoxy-1,4-benzoquinol methylase